MLQFRVAFPTPAFDRTLAFYRDLLDAEVMTAWEEPERGVVLAITPAGGCIELFDGGPEQSVVDPALLVSIELASTVAVDALATRLGDAGVAFTVPLGDAPWGHRHFRVRDPSGLELGFWSPLGPGH